MKTDSDPQKTSTSDKKNFLSSLKNFFSGKKFSAFVIIYLLIGLIFAFVYMINYHWPLTGLFSPGFYVVILTWPFQLFGLIQDVQYYGWGGKPF